MNPRSVAVGKWLLAFTAIFTVGTINYLLPSAGAYPTLPLYAGGVAVAACVRWGRPMWVAVLAATVGTYVCAHYTLIASLFIGLGSAGGAALTAWILGWRGFDTGFSRARDVPLFILASGLGTMLVPTLGLLGYRLAGDHAALTDPLHWLRWWSNATAGVLLAGPMLVALSRRSLAQFAEHWVAAGCWLLGVTICCMGALSVDAASVGRPIIIMLALLLVVVAAIRFGLVVAAFGTLLVTAAAGLSLAFHSGIFGGYDKFAGLAAIWSFTAALTGVALIIISLLAERDRAALERLRAEHRYAQIFDGNPQPLWVHDPGSLEFLLVNAAAVRQYGWSREQFLTLRVSALAPPGRPAVLPPGAGRDGAEAAPEPYETRHQTCDGRVLAVEVWTRAIDLSGRRAELVFASDVTERRALGCALIDVIAAEQRRIGRELHDGLGQELTGLALSARALATRAERERQPIAAALDQLAAMAANCIQGARRIAQGVSPLSDVDGNLPIALEMLAARSTLGATKVRFRSRLESGITLELEPRNHLYRIAQEAVQNALKHAHARNIEIELSARAHHVCLTVNDDGRGLPEGGPRGTGLGTRTMHFRAGSMGGRLVIANRSGGGVSVSCEVAQPQAVDAVA
ncbi:MAG TPA: ATP-binding protein [Steroidobacteraceae bacterium]|nr:ATP-binding protein [Steroidobacteraceae bacterium]